MDDRADPSFETTEIGLRVEEWRGVPGYGGRYEVSSHGRVRSWVTCRGGTIADESHILQQSPISKDILDGALSVNLYHAVEFTRGGRGYRVSTLVAAVFLGPRPEGKSQVIFLDGNNRNFHSSNLAYATKAEAVAHIRKYTRSRKRFPRGGGKLTDSQLGAIRRFYRQGRFEPGPNRVCVSDVARRYGVGRATIYRAIDRYREEEECQTGNPMKRIFNSGSS
ncbi:hypothetical protein [uncultured Mediterranean phage]|nr:hypothetical protein [uncultured Mediterranean phage]